jgi:phospholipid/cholesterol/gamma-HCH transport system permease protein
MPEDADILTIEGAKGGEVVILLKGRVGLESLQRLMEGLSHFFTDWTPSSLTVDLAGVSYLDSAGAFFLIEVEREARLRSLPFKTINISKKEEGVLKLVHKDALVAPPLISEKRSEGIVVELGEEAIKGIDDIAEVITFAGAVVTELIHALLHPRSVRWGDVLEYMKKVGVDGVPIVGLISLLLGLIIAFMSALQLRQFGANVYIPALVGLAMVRELGPIMTAILVAGRSGSAFAAEIGTMKVNEEVDALITMGFNPVRFLAIPKVLAAVAVVPLLTVFSDVFAIAGGMFVGVTLLDLTVYTYVQETVNALDLFNVVISIVKSVVFAILIAGIGCQRGFRVTGGAEAVGNAATSAVVAGLFLIIVVDSTFAIVLNYVG